MSGPNVGEGGRVRARNAFWVIYPQFCIFLTEEARNIVGLCHRQPNHYFQSVDNL